MNPIKIKSPSQIVLILGGFDVFLELADTVILMKKMRERQGGFFLFLFAWGRQLGMFGLRGSVLVSMDQLLSAAFSNFKIQINSVFDTCISIIFKILFEGAGLVPVSEQQQLKSLIYPFLIYRQHMLLSREQNTNLSRLNLGKFLLCFPCILFYLGCQMMQAIYELFFLIFLKWVSSVCNVLMIHLQKGK